MGTSTSERMPVAAVHRKTLRPAFGVDGDGKLTEFAILIAAREWTNNFEWNAHANAATTAGLNAAIIAAVADGRRPERMSEDEEIIWDFCNELLHNKSGEECDKI